MSKGLIAGLVAVGLLGGVSLGDPLVESWEDVLNGWMTIKPGQSTPPFYQFDSWDFVHKSDPLYGEAVTRDNYALALDLQSGWKQWGLYYGWDIDYFAPLSGACVLALDVTSSSADSRITGNGSFELGLYIRGEVMVDGIMTPLGDYVMGVPGYGEAVTFDYIDVTSVHAGQLTKQTVAWNLGLNGVPLFDPAEGGWMEMRIHPYVHDCADPGFIYVDNLRVVPEPATLALLSLAAVGTLRRRR